MREIVGMPDRVRSLRARLDVLQLRLDRREGRQEPASVLALLGRERRDEKAVLERGLAHRRGAHLTAPPPGLRTAPRAGCSSRGNS